MSQNNLRSFSNTGTNFRSKNQKISSLGEYYPANFTLIPNYDSYYTESLQQVNGVGFTNKINIDKDFRSPKYKEAQQSPSTMASTLSHFFQNSKNQTKNTNQNLTNINNRILTIKHKHQNLKTYNSILQNKKNNLVRAKITAAQMRQSMDDLKLSQMEMLQQKKNEVKMQRQQYLNNIQKRKELKEMQMKVEQDYFKQTKQKLKEEQEDKYNELIHRNQQSVRYIQETDQQKRYRLIQYQLYKQQQFTQEYQSRIKMQNQRYKQYQNQIEKLKETEKDALLELQQEQQKQEEIEDEYEQNLNSKLTRWGSKSTRNLNTGNLFVTQSMQPQKKQQIKDQKQITSYNVQTDF